MKELNLEGRKRRKEITAAARRAQELTQFDSLFFPKEYVKVFEGRIRMRTAGSEAHLQRLFSHFRFIQEMILKLKILPSEYRDKSDYIYRYFAEKQLSLDYSHKLIQMLNMWGMFVSKRQGRFYEHLERPSRAFTGLIAKAQRKAVGRRRASKRLNIGHLERFKGELPEAQYNWLFVSLWFGLRPNEVDVLKDGAEVIVNSSGVQVLKVYQSKIDNTGDIEDAYKYIPILYPEQNKALTMLPNIERPRAKALKSIVPEIDTYSGRKGFADLMQSLGQKLEPDISMWLGHKDSRTTRKHYKDRANVPFTPVNNKKVS